MRSAGDGGDLEDYQAAHPLWGSLAIIFAALIVVLSVMDRSASLSFMPLSWYANRALWYLIAFGSFLAGCALLRSRRVPADRPPGAATTQPVFDRVVLYTRQGCHLCDQAKQTLLTYRRHITSIEEIDIDTSADLVEKFGECVPVIELDGKVRFRGEVNETLLQRLIDAQH